MGHEEKKKLGQDSRKGQCSRAWGSEERGETLKYSCLGGKKWRQEKNSMFKLPRGGCLENSFSSYEHRLPFQKMWVQFPGPTLWLTRVCNSRARASNAPF